MFMLLDHVGMLWDIYPLRCIGRLAMPLFAFLLAEGCRYTKNKLAHLANILLFASIAQIVYVFLHPGEIYLNILFTFSFSILIIYALQHTKKTHYNPNASLWQKILSLIVCALVIVLVYFIFRIDSLNGKKLVFDYGFYGCLLPVFPAVLDFFNIKLPQKMQWLDCYYLKIAAFAIGLVLVCVDLSAYQWYSLIALIILLFYNGKKGKYNTKYFFYIFYPAHLAILYGLSVLLV